MMDWSDESEERKLQMQMLLLLLLLYVFCHNENENKRVYMEQTGSNFFFEVDKKRLIIEDSLFFK